MKKTLKLLLVCALLLIPIEKAEARFYLGGNIGIGNTGNNGVYLRLAPEFGWYISNNFNIGGQFSFTTNSTNYSIVPYLRWSFVNLNNRLRIFLSCNTPVSRVDSTTSIGAILRPGIALRVANNVSLAAQIGNFGYYWYLDSGNRSGEWIARINSDNISIGFVVNL